MSVPDQLVAMFGPNSVSSLSCSELPKRRFEQVADRLATYKLTVVRDLLDVAVSECRKRGFALYAY